MKKSFEQEEQCLPSIDKPKWERFIQPQSPEQPLIRIYRNEKESCFDAAFAIELAGVDRKESEISNKSIYNENGNYGIVESYRNLFISAAASNQGLEFVYSGGRDDSGKAYFSWKIVGRSKASSFEAAATEINSLWQNINVITGSVRNGYTFIPVIEPEKLKDETNEGWVGVVRPVGVSINTDSARPLGFIQEAKSRITASSVLIAPRHGLKEAKVFDPVATAFAGCSSEVKVVLSLKRFKLSCDELRTVTSALRWLRNGVSKGISYHPEIREGSNNEELINGLGSALELWLKNPMGLRVNCMVMSKKLIPSSFLSLAGSVIFNGAPFSVSMKKYGTAGNVNKSGAFTLDLQDCINDAAAMPPVFPGVSTLLDCNVKRTFPQAAFDMPSDGILLGNIGCGSASKDVRLSGTDRSRHCYVLGSTGTGKSTLLFNMIKQDIENGEGVTLIDPHGDLYQEILSSIPEKRMDDVVLVDPCDFGYSPGINFLECNGPHKTVQINFAANEMLKIFDRLYDMRSAGGPIFEQYMRNALLLIMDNEYDGATLMDLPLLFEDEEYREFLKKGCKNPFVKGFWEGQVERISGDMSLKNMGPYITSKLNQFTTNALLRPIIGQSKSTIDLREIMDKGKILLINLSKGYLGEFDTQLLGMLIVGKLFSCAMSRVALRPEERRPMALYIDEFQNFTTDSISYMLSEARKFGLSLVLANQNMSQIKGHNILDSVLGNVGSMMLFRLGAMDAEKMVTYTRPALQVHDLQELPDFHAAARLLNKNVLGKPFVFKTKPLMLPIGSVPKDAIISASRLKYALSTTEVENQILARRTEYKNGIPKEEM